MSLVPHKITALAESDAQGTSGKNIVAGAIVSLYDTGGAAVTLFDNEAGANGSTTKQTDATGQVVVYVTPGEYDEEVNGSVKRRVTIGGNSAVDVATFAALEALRPQKTGQAFICQERANAKYILQASGHTALAGDVTFANGRVGELQIDGDCLAEWFGVVGDGVNVNSEILQQSIDRISSNTVSTAKYGGALIFGSGIYLATGLILKDRVMLKGAGRGASIIKAPDGTNLNVLTIHESANLVGWAGLTINGNRQGNTSGSGIAFESTGSSFGNSFSPYTDKISQGEFSYKHVVANDFSVGNCPQSGIKTEPSNFQIFFDNFACAHNGEDGLFVRSSDGNYSNFYLEKNGRCGLHSSGSANKYSTGKVIWNGRDVNDFGGLREQGTRNCYTMVEAQDNYCDGILILGESPDFINCLSNTNGYSAVGSEDVSSRVHADIRIGSSASGITFEGSVYSYKEAVGSDGFWTTEYPYFFNSYSPSQIKYFNIKYQDGKYNQRPNINVDFAINNNITDVGSFSSAANQTFYDISPSTESGEGNSIVRIFRRTLSDAAKVDVHIPNTSTVNHRIDAAGNASFCLNSGDVQTGNGAWDGQRLKLGNFFLWVDSAGRLRIKNGAPTNDTDGTIVGVQS